MLAGSFVLKNTNFCAKASGTDCYWTLNQAGSWDPNTNFIGIVAGWKGAGGQSDTAADVTVELISSELQGGVQSVQRMDVSTSSSTQGPLVTSKMSIGQSLTTYAFPTLQSVPVALPGNPPAFGIVQPPSNFSG
jgi:hypothetical protein